MPPVIPAQCETITSDIELLTAARQANDTASFEQFVTRHFDLALRLARRQTGSAHDADDCLQQAVVQAIHGLNSFDPTRGQPRAWFLTIVVNACRQHHRQSTSRQRRHNHPRAAGVHAHRESQPDDDYVQREHHEAIRAAVAELPEHERLPVWMHAGEGLTFGEIASILERSENTVKSQARRGLQRLRQRLRPEALLILLATPWAWAIEEHGDPTAALHAVIQSKNSFKDTANPTAPNASNSSRSRSHFAFSTAAIALIAILLMAYAAPDHIHAGQQFRPTTAATNSPTLAVRPQPTWQPDTIASELMSALDLSLNVDPLPHSETIGSTKVGLRDVTIEGRTTTAYNFGFDSAVVGLRYAPLDRLHLTESVASLRLSLLVRKDPALGITQFDTLPVVFGIPQRRLEANPWPRDFSEDPTVALSSAQLFNSGAWLPVVVEMTMEPQTQSLIRRTHLNDKLIEEARFHMGADYPTTVGAPMISVLLAVTQGIAVEIADPHIETTGCRPLRDPSLNF